MDSRSARVPGRGAGLVVTKGPPGGRCRRRGVRRGRRTGIRSQEGSPSSQDHRGPEDGHSNSVCRLRPYHKHHGASPPPMTGLAAVTIAMMSALVT